MAKFQTARNHSNSRAFSGAWEISRRIEMGELADRIKGETNEAIGKAKRAMGEATNDPALKARGDAQEAKGDLQNAAAKVEGAMGNKV